VNGTLYTKLQWCHVGTSLTHCEVSSQHEANNNCGISQQGGGGESEARTAE